MAPHKAVSLSTLTLEQLQARYGDLWFEKPKIRAYNVVVEAVDVLYEAAVEGNAEASKRLRRFAEEITWAVADAGLSLLTTDLGSHHASILAVDTLYEAIADADTEVSKPLARLAEQAIQAAGDKDL
jgi:hypothetical protein